MAWEGGLLHRIAWLTAVKEEPQSMASCACCQQLTGHAWLAGTYTDTHRFSLLKMKCDKLNRCALHSAFAEHSVGHLLLSGGKNSHKEREQRQAELQALPLSTDLL